MRAATESTTEESIPDPVGEMVQQVLRQSGGEGVPNSVNELAPQAPMKSAGVVIRDPLDLPFLLRAILEAHERGKL